MRKEHEIVFDCPDLKTDNSSGPLWRPLVIPAALSLMVVLLWVFPDFWYTNLTPKGQFLWLCERTSIPGWNYRAIPVSSAAEAELGADAYFNGEFVRGDGTMVRAFGIKRFAEGENEVDMFAHNPDRCWPLVGWTLTGAEPDLIDLELYGHRMFFERRLFENGSQRELVYFGALVGGKPLPHRLDYYLAFGLNATRPGGLDRSGTLTRAMDKRFWVWVWNSFKERRPLGGAKHFIRISTPVQGRPIPDADALLKSFLLEWLTPGELEADAQLARSKRPPELPVSQKSIR